METPIGRNLKLNYSHEQKIHVTRRLLRGKPHHTGREKAQGGDCLSKAGLAVDMGRNALSGVIFVGDECGLERL